MTYLQYAADVASIFTFLGGLIVYLRYECGMKQKSRRLERYLRQEKRKGGDQGQRSILHIVRHVGLTEDEIIQASFRNRRIARRVATGPQPGLATALLFEYDESEPSN